MAEPGYLKVGWRARFGEALSTKRAFPRLPRMGVDAPHPYHEEDAEQDPFPVPSNLTTQAPHPVALTRVLYGGCYIPSTAGSVFGPRPHLPSLPFQAEDRGPDTEASVRPGTCSARIAGTGFYSRNRRPARTQKLTAFGLISSPKGPVGEPVAKRRRGWTSSVILRLKR